MYQEKENILPVMKATAKLIAANLPVLNFALYFYEETKAQAAQRKVLRLEEFYRTLSERIGDIKEKINTEYVSKEDFADIFEQTANHIMNERIENKRRCFQNVFENSIVAESCSYDKTEKYMRLLVDMSWLELKVLSVLNNPAKYNEKVGNVIKDPDEGNFIGFGIATRSYNHIDILVKLLNESQDEIKDALYFLQSNRLIVEQSNAIRSQANGHPIHILDNMLTTKGKDFVCFVLNSPSI
jgi:hypothetical protein